MRLPAVAMAAAFASGIALGLWANAGNRFSSLPFLRGAAIVAGLLLLLALLILRARNLRIAVTLSTAAWIVIGIFSARIAQQPRRADFVLNLVRAQRIDLHEPMRWHVRLRDEPQQLPWGTGYELDLLDVEIQGATVPVSGGLRLNYSPQEGDSAAPELHAGDTFWVFTQARLPQVYRDEGAFDRRAYLAQQDIDLVGTLRAAELIEDIVPGTPTVTTRLARARRHLREKIDTLFATRADEAAVLRAMLLGDRTFVARDASVEFQKTGVFHVLVVAGLHVAAFAAFLFWIGKRVRISRGMTALLTFLALAAYVAVIEQRAPVLRAALMASVVIFGTWFFRRLELLNSAGIAGLILLVANPLALRDSSFQLSFLAIGCIGGLGVPWLARTVEPYAKALRGWRDVTRDAAFVPRVAQFRIDLRSVAAWVAARLPRVPAKCSGGAVIRTVGVAFRCWELFVLSVVLQIGMQPMMAADFHRVTLAGPVVNMIVVPLTGVIVPLGFAVLVLGLVLQQAGLLLAAPLGWITAGMLQVVHWFAEFPRWSYRIPGPPVWLDVGFLAVAILLAVFLRSSSRQAIRVRAWITVLLLAGAVTIATHPLAASFHRGELELNVLDVGQGDSLFVVFPQGRTLLIDGGGAFAFHGGRADSQGPDPGEDAVSSYLWSRGFQKIDAVALTHAHLDHAGGLAAVLENFRVKELWIGREAAAPVMKKLEELASARGVRIVRRAADEAISWDGAEIRILWPERREETLERPAANDDSLVMRLHFKGRTFLLPGDAEKGAERNILAENPEAALRADVLKIGHHGSKNSTMPEFLAEVRPGIGIISAGEENPYGHPSAELLKRLEAAGVRILRTDRDGAIHVSTDGTNVRVSCFVECGRILAVGTTTRPSANASEKMVQGPAPKGDKDHEQQ